MFFIALTVYRQIVFSSGSDGIEHLSSNRNGTAYIFQTVYSNEKDDDRARTFHIYNDIHEDIKSRSS